MARLCIRIANNDHPTNAALTPLRTRPGDVVEMCEDGHEWRPGELNCGQYRFVDLPGVPAADLVHLKTAVHDANGVMVRRFNQTLDISALNAGAWRTRTSATRSQIDAITITRTA
jgi:hypothetical protein